MTRLLSFSLILLVISQPMLAVAASKSAGIKACKEATLGDDSRKNRIKIYKCFVKTLKRGKLKQAVNKGNLALVIKIQEQINQFEAKLDELIKSDEADAKRRGAFGGTWSSNLGVTTIAQFDDGTISGTWRDPSSGDLGSISGSVVGLSLSGSWSFNGQSGSYSLSLPSKNAKSFSGYCGAAGPWVGSRE